MHTVNWICSLTRCDLFTPGDSILWHLGSEITPHSQWILKRLNLSIPFCSCLPFVNCMFQTRVLPLHSALQTFINKTDTSAR